MNKRLSEYFSLNRRYSRSINVERDLELPNTVPGYVLTEKSVDALRRILAAFTSSPVEPPGRGSGVANHPTRAWTLTGVYGTGKSAFAHYLASVCANQTSQMRHYALDIAKNALGSDSLEYKTLENIPQQGLFRAIATAQREPLSHTIIRALERGAGIFWRSARTQPAIARKLVDLATEITFGKTTVDSRIILGLVQEVASSAQTDVLLIIDELGKNLEFAAQNQGADDLYLLQQLAERERKNGPQVYILCLLHQSFAEYSQRLTSKERNEWAKIQGRFEDIPFTESADAMTRLIGQAIDTSSAEAFQFVIYKRAEEWFECLHIANLNDITPAILAAATPLHPITALVLPMLCTRYAQNDRSLFTFLTSEEPLSFKNFLDEATVEGDTLPTLKLYQVYDYFVESVGMGLASRPNLQRWLEIQGLIADAKHLAPESQQILKTIGTLNLVTSTGSMRATRALVKLAMCDCARDENQLQHWEQVIEELLKRGLITYRRQLDELRIWEGSDFDVEGEIAAYVEKERSPLVKILSEVCPLKPLVAQRHSYKTGTLRYFERQYLDSSQDLATLHCSSNDCDGLVGYWVDDTLPNQVPDSSADGKPLIVLCAAKLDLLRIRALEFAALKKIQKSASQLQTDAVARREVRHRLVQAKRLLDETLSQVFDVADSQNICWIQGQQEAIAHITAFNVKLSDVCDKVYHKSLILWNELINRRELTSQGAKARRLLIEAMLERSDQERLGLQGYGPEVSMYYSLLGETGIHRQEQDWGFHPPLKKERQLRVDLLSEVRVNLFLSPTRVFPQTAVVSSVWQAIEDFCLQAKEKPQTLDKLYNCLEAPPFGLKLGAIPVLLAAVLLQHVNDVSVYRDGTFIPVLGAEHFELLVKDPSRFAVKYFEVAGLRSQVFKELEAILRSANAQMPTGVRNVTLLTLVKPLFQFVKKLPASTTKTKRLSSEAQAVLQTLRDSQEPDELLFTSLPQACGLSPIVVGEADDGTIAITFRKKLVAALHEIQTAYDCLLSECQTLLYDAFAVRSSDKLREDLRVRASYLVGQCLEPSLRRFTLFATDDTARSREWLEALVMIVADKPAESWTDEDVTGFEIKLSDIARRFKNLEALQKEVAASTGEGIDARRITVTRLDGQEVHQTIWFDHERQEETECLFEEILSRLNSYNSTQLQQAVVAKLAERILGLGSQDNISQL